jgi:quercetin dioxygenase-like cupin family protein
MVMIERPFWPALKGSNKEIEKMETKKHFAVDTNAVPWEENFNAKIGHVMSKKTLFSDPDTGMSINIVRYPAGAVTPEHTHNCAHGMYVIDGTLVTHSGRFGPGSLVWFDEGSVMQHGASAESQVTVLFITNKPFNINYLED